MPNFSSRFTSLTGLRLMPQSWTLAMRAVLLCIALVTGFIVALDALLFREHLSSDYITSFSSPPWPRMLRLSLLAAVEEVQFRLLLMTALAAMAVRIQGRLTLPAAIAIIAAAQFANVGTLVLADPWYAIPRYWLVGCVWGWLYWRRGWLAALAGHTLTHPLLDPALFWALTR
jgi:Type II CAAX prenyl endopeptidase Rce1-like